MMQSSAGTYSYGVTLHWCWDEMFDVEGTYPYSVVELHFRVEGWPSELKVTAFFWNIRKVS